MGYRLTKFILAATLLISGVWIAVEGFDADNMQTLPECLSGLVLFLAGMILASRKMESFNLFRTAVGGVIGCLAVRFIGDAVVSIMNAPSLEMNTSQFVSSIIQIVASVVMAQVTSVGLARSNSSCTTTAVRSATMATPRMARVAAGA